MAECLTWVDATAIRLWLSAGVNPQKPDACAKFLICFNIL